MALQRIVGITALFLCCLLMHSAESQLSTKGSFFQGVGQAFQTDTKNEETFWTTAKHHECSRENDCRYVVDENGKGKEQILVNEEIGLEEFTSSAVVWEKKAPEGFKDCKEAFEEGVRKNGQIKILWKNGKSFFADCDMTTDGGGWTVFQRRENNSLDFQKPWEECKNGFGDVKGNFWLGLEAVAFLTSRGNIMLRVDLKNGTGESGYAKYTNFKVNDEVRNYQLQLTYKDGNIGDSMSSNNGMSFSTYDRDNDNNSDINFAYLTGGPWWHGDNYTSNLNNVYYIHSQTFLQAMTWKTWNNNVGGLSFSEMKLRRED